MKKLRFIPVLAILFLCTSVLAADWYVDNGASGINNGTSWTKKDVGYGNVYFVASDSNENLFIGKWYQVSTGRDYGFIYSNNKGITWLNANFSYEIIHLNKRGLITWSKNML